MAWDVMDDGGDDVDPDPARDTEQQQEKNGYLMYQTFGVVQKRWDVMTMVMVTTKKLVRVLDLVITSVRVACCDRDKQHMLRICSTKSQHNLCFNVL